MKVLAASLRVGFCDEWKRGFRPIAFDPALILAARDLRAYASISRLI
jgi:hypothetical protein